MLVKIKWFMTGNFTEINEADDLLNPNTSILELKGLIQIRFGFPAKELVLIHNHLLDNYMTLGQVGFTLGADAGIVLTAHVVRQEASLEKKNAIDGQEEEEDDIDDDSLQEFSHDDFIMAMKMLGKDVPVSNDRLQQVRDNAPRSRPTFLNSQQSAAPSTSAGPTDGSYNPRNTQVHKIFQDYRYGMRKDGADVHYKIEYPGIPEPYQYWDMRLPEDEAHQDRVCSVNEVCFELFFFGEFTVIKDTDKFLALIRRMLEVECGVQAKTPLPMREAGCMYPLIAVPVVMTEMEGMIMGERVFDDFGTALPSTKASSAEDGTKVAGKGSACAQQ